MTHRLVKGFTLIELILLIGVIGILSAVAIPKFSGTQQISLYIQSQQILSDIRFAQGLSISTGTRYRWQRLNANSYSVVNSSGAAIQLASGRSIMTLSNGITMTTNLPNSILVFDRVGTPYIDSLLPGTLLSTPALITLSLGSLSSVVSITPGTGFGVIQ